MHRGILLRQSRYERCVLVDTRLGSSRGQAVPLLLFTKLLSEIVKMFDRKLDYLVRVQLVARRSGKEIIILEYEFQTADKWPNKSPIARRTF